MDDDIVSVLDCLAARQENYHKSQPIFTTGEEIRKIGVILSGSVQIVKDDVWGNRTILAKLSDGDLFGEAFCFSDKKGISVNVIASETCEILFIDYRKIITTCSASCTHHNKLIENMMKVLANKNIMLTEKMEILSKRSTKEKILSYLSYQAEKCDNSTFRIPFDRQELSDYLCVDRSALSKELSKLQDNGKFKFKRNYFELKQHIDS